MAKPVASSKPQGVRAQIKAAPKKAAKAKFATLKRIAATEPQEFHRAIAQLEAGFGAIKAAFNEFRTNLGLVSIPKNADLKTRIAAKRNYASRFRRIAEEAPEEIASAMGEVYMAIDGLAEDMENLADNLGITLETPTEEVIDGVEIEPVGIAEEEHEVVEEAEEAGLPVPEELEEHEEEEVEEVEEHEASGSDWFVSDRDEKGEPKAPVVASKRRPVVQAR